MSILSNWCAKKGLDSPTAVALLAGCNAARIREVERYEPVALPRKVVRLIEQLDGPEVAAAIAAGYKAERAARAVEIRRALAAT